MEQRDYLERQIEETGKVLRYILSEILKLPFVSSLQEIDNETQILCKKELDIDITKLTELTPNQIIEVSASKTNLTFEHIEIIADMYIALANKETDDSNKNKYLGNARDILEYIESKDSIKSFSRIIKLQKLRS